MFGKNKIVKQQQPENYDDTIGIVEIFHTLQGEGMFSGVPAVFIRTKDCCLSCYFCDTEFSSGNNLSVVDIVDAAESLTTDNQTNLVVITGGEPMIHLGVRPLIMQLLAKGFTVQMETCGVIALEGLPRDDPKFQIVCSPKTPRIHEYIYENAAAFKYIITAGEVSIEDGLPTASTQIEGKPSKLCRPKSGTPVYLTPCDPHTSDNDYVRNTSEAVKSCLRYGYTLNLQLHKIVGLP